MKCYEVSLRIIAHAEDEIAATTIAAEAVRLLESTGAHAIAEASIHMPYDKQWLEGWQATRHAEWHGFVHLNADEVQSSHFDRPQKTFA